MDESLDCNNRQFCQNTKLISVIIQTVFCISLNFKINTSSNVTKYTCKCYSITCIVNVNASAWWNKIRKSTIYKFSKLQWPIERQIEKRKQKYREQEEEEDVDDENEYKNNARLSTDTTK